VSAHDFTRGRVEHTFKGALPSRNGTMHVVLVRGWSSSRVSPSSGERDRDYGGSAPLKTGGGAILLIL
jgi:hypothetical protein